MTRFALLLSLIFLPFGLSAAEPALVTEAPSELSPEQQQALAQARAFWNSLDRQTGEIALPGGVARLNVPETFYYLNPDDASRVLVEVWGNPPGTRTLGMLMPADVTPFDRESWGVTIEYDAEGYVDDDDAASLDYAELLEQMKQATREASAERVRQGFESIELVGWAAEPFYDAKSHKLHWARELRFGGDGAHILNYNIRVLGRKGVLVLNFIADMNQKGTINDNLDTVLSMASFNDGYRYEDFNPDLDEVAAYGVGALITGNILAKTGVLAGLLLFLKKFGVFIVIGIGWVISRLFGRRNKQSQS